MFKTLLKAAAVTTALVIPSVAAAATAAIVTTDLNLRSGPGTGYSAFASIPSGNQVAVYGCASGYNWCDIGWAGYRGWVSGRYLAYREGGDYYDRPVSSVGVYIGVPVIGFDLYGYHDRYYRGRPWYRDRDHWDRWDRDDDWRYRRPGWRDGEWRGRRWDDDRLVRNPADGRVVNERWLRHQQSIAGERNR